MASIDDILEQGTHAQYSTITRAAERLQGYMQTKQYADAKRYVISEQKIASKMEESELKTEYTKWLKEVRVALPETTEHPYFRRAW